MTCGRPRAPSTPIHVTRGATATFTFTVRVDPATGETLASIAGVDPVATGSAVDLTGAKVWFTAKNRIEDPASVIAKKNTLAGGVDNQIHVASPQSGATLGQFVLTLDPADTAPLDPVAIWCDAWVQLAGGPPLRRYQVMKNRQLVLDPTVTTVF